MAPTAAATPRRPQRISARCGHVCARWLRRAAEQGLASAQGNLALLCLQGRGVVRDPIEAAGWMRRAADQGLVVAQARLGTMYELGRGVLTDPVEAYAWYDRAAAQGDAAARERREALARTMSVQQLVEAEALARAWREER